ncbi:Trp biosynthesis-associated membrane protein [Pseudactinotalea sp. Z1732]|uniref:Trp biosynthesis-associated membrane protein n=1 Tax=Pseudactinotalea sp. Z1732 TaxID=3413026 RepID=UPI003C7EAE71
MSRGRMVLVLVLLGAGAFGLSLLTWVGAEAVTTLGPQPVRVSGAGAAPVVPSAALVVVVAGLAVGLSGPVVRILAPAAAALAAVVALIAGLVLIADPDPAARSAAGEVGGVREITGAAELTVWPWVVVVLLASTVLVALVLPFRAGTWAPAAARYERAVVRPEGAGPAGTRASGAATGQATSRADWDALSSGLDPSATDDDAHSGHSGHDEPGERGAGRDASGRER